MYIADRKLCLDTSKTIVVEASDPSAAFPFVEKGAQLLESIAEKYGISVKGGKLVLK